MPKKRTTARVKRPAPKLPGFSSDMSKSEREEQLEVLKKEIDYKVLHTLRTFAIEATQVKLKIKNMFDIYLQQIPEALQTMTLEEFAECGGTFEDALRLKDSSTKNSHYLKIASLVEDNPASRGDVLVSIKEEGSDNQKSGRKDTVPRNPKSQRQAIHPPVMGPQGMRSSARVSKTRFATPASWARKAEWGATPLITPKFDPNLPKTPDNIRDRKPGERLMSIAGSPVKVEEGSRDGLENIPSVEVIEECLEQFADIAGVTLTPNRVERMLRLGGTIAAGLHGSHTDSY